MDLDDIADELYGCLPADFTAARDHRAGEARAAGETAKAAAIKKLRRPTAAAWLSNQVARQRDNDLTALVALGAEMQAAQASRDGKQLQQLSGRRSQLVAAIVTAAGELAEKLDQPATASILSELRATLDAAIADPAAGEAVRAGRLTTSLSYSGFGGVDLSDAVAITPPSRAATRESALKAAPATRKGRNSAASSATSKVEATTATKAKVEAAKQAVEAAREAAKNQKRSVDNVSERVEGLQRQLDALEEQVRRIRRETTHAHEMLRRTQRQYDAATRAVKDAERAQLRAVAELDQLG